MYWRLSKRTTTLPSYLGNSATAKLYCRCPHFLHFYESKYVVLDMHLVWYLILSCFSKNTCFSPCQRKEFWKPICNHRRNKHYFIRSFFFLPTVVSIKATLLLPDKFTTSNDVLKLHIVNICHQYDYKMMWRIQLIWRI